MKVLFLGGTGTISSACAALAQELGWQVALMNRGSRPAPEGMELIQSEKDQKWGGLKDTFRF